MREHQAYHRSVQRKHKAANQKEAALALHLAGESERARRLVLAALAAFLLAGLTGSLLRFWLWQGFPAWANFGNVRHAHSHLMYFAWVTPALMALIAARLPALTGRRNHPGLWASAAAALVLGLLSFPPFFLWGYRAVETGGLRLPLAVIVSSLNILAWYVFAFFYRKATRGAPGSRPLKLWNAALAFLLAASLGAWGMAILSALGLDDPFLAAAAVHLFLDLFSGGWAILGVLGVIYAAHPRLSQRVSGWEDPLLFLGLPLSFLLGIRVDLVPTDLRTLAGLGGLLAAAGLALHLRVLWSELAASSLDGWRAPLVCLALSAGMQAAAALPPLAAWAERAGLRIFYLHVLLLGYVTLGLVNGFRQLWTETGKTGQRPLVWAVAGMLLSLLLITGLWPAALTGLWRLGAVFLFSLGPWAAAAGIALRLGALRRSREQPAPAAKPPIPRENRAEAELP